MTTASRSLATALPVGALRERFAPPSYTTTGDTTVARATALKNRRVKPSTVRGRLALPATRGCPADVGMAADARTVDLVLWVIDSAMAGELPANLDV